VLARVAYSTAMIVHTAAFLLSEPMRRSESTVSEHSDGRTSCPPTRRCSRLNAYIALPFAVSLMQVSHDNQHAKRVLQHPHQKSRCAAPLLSDGHAAYSGGAVREDPTVSTVGSA
jgi:hypothetical protein